MSIFLRHRIALLLHVGLALAAASSAQAQSITCNASMSALTFASVDPLSSQTDATATLTYTCTNSANAARAATLCFSIGEPGGAQTNPRLMSDGAGHTLQFQLYQDAAHSTVWGSSFFGTFLTPYQVDVSVAKNTSTGTLSHTMYGRVVAAQTGVVPGAYQDIYVNGDTALTINQNNNNTAPGTCSATNTDYFPFNVTATVAKNCTVSATTLDFGTPAGFLTANVDVTSTITTQCTSTTPYQIGLNNGANASGTVRRMAGGTAEFIAYELYRNSARSTRWGNTVGVDTVAATGNGNALATTVYGRVAPQATPSPGSYSDTITVSVTY
ncbi:MAG: spore coat U domain-containing protein [Rudaea sp.]